MPLADEKEFIRKMDSSPRFPVVFVFAAVVAICITGWGMVRCVNLCLDAAGFVAAVLPFSGTLVLDVLMVAGF